MIFNRLTALICGIVICTGVYSQKKDAELKFGDIKPDDFKLKYYDIDSSAEAVYLYNFGSAYYDFDGVEFSTVYKIHKRIRLLSKNSFDNVATVKIPIYQDELKENQIQDFHASTYTLDNGKVNEASVDKKSIFKDKDGDFKILKFTFPNLKEGCIIEYSYTERIADFMNLPSWDFQSEYPELWSEYTVSSPSFLEFVVLKNGYLTPAVDTVTLSFQSGFNNDIVNHRWAFKNVPSLKEESYITSLSNYRQSVQFQVSALQVPGRDTRYFMHTWYQTAEDLMKDDDFGADLNKENGWLKDDVKAAEAGETDSLAKAKKIFQYVRDNYSCTDNSSMWLSQPIKKTAQTKKGNVADINMLLVAMLKVAGFNTNPVLLSTRDHGKTYDIYPILEKFNYLIAQVHLNNQSFLLDASDPVLGFNHLSEDCYNGSARIINSNPLIVNLSADSLHESEVSSLFLNNDDNGNMSGIYKCVMGEMQSDDMREKMKKSNADDYFKDVKKSFSFDVDLSNTTIDSLKQQDMPVSVQYNFSFKPDDDIIYFNPMVAADVYKENPFKAAQRFYPVEMPYCIDKTYILNMEIPKGYKVDELPKSARISLNENEGMFEYLIQQSDDHIQMRCRTKLNKATFEPDDYETLRNFFAAIVEKESEQIVFKKM